MSDPRFPVGEFAFDGEMSDERRRGFIDDIGRTPAELRCAVDGLGDEQLDMPYRDGGWTVRQVVHHMPDSHMNSYIRMKLAVTEDAPTIRPYFEDRWGELADARTAPIGISLDLLEALHVRWTLWLRGLDAAACARTFVHPELGTSLTLDEAIAMYSWHGRHHVAHVTALRERMGW